MSESELGEFSEILPNLFLTGEDGITEYNIRTFNIKLILNVASNVEAAEFPGVRTIKYDLVDKQSENISDYFDEICDIIAYYHARDKNVVVHCQAGCSRSVTIVLAYLMKHKGFDLRTAYYATRDRREVINPNPGFFRQLIAYERELFGETTVKMVKSERSHNSWTGVVPDVYLEDD